MQFSKRRPNEPEIQLTSLIDVVLLLVIFFMVTTSFVKESALSLELPTTDSAAPASQESDLLDISIAADAKYSVNGQVLANQKPLTLRLAIERAIGERRDLPVVIHADGKTSHQAVVTAMDAVASVGLTRVRIATVDESN